MEGMTISDLSKAQQKHVISRYVAKYFKKDSVPKEAAEYKQLIALRDEILGIMQKADGLAQKIREQGSE